MATHSLVTMPVPSHSQNRKKCEGTGPRSSERWAWQRCRKMVTPAMVMWVVTRAYSSSCHHDSCHRPWAIQSTARFQTDPKSSDITEAFGKAAPSGTDASILGRSEEHTSELQSPCNLVCRLLLEKKKKKDESGDVLLHRSRAVEGRDVSS